MTDAASRGLPRQLISQKRWEFGSPPQKARVTAGLRDHPKLISKRSF
jgi:hypothetical protein